MISPELLEELHKLSRVEKLRVIQMLASDLSTQEEGQLTPGATYEIWSPYDAPQAAEALMKLLEEDQGKND